MKTYVFWCLTCPTRLHVEHDKGDVEFWQGRSYTTCPVCGGPLADPQKLMTDGSERPDGSRFKIVAKTAAEHAKLLALGPEEDRKRDRDRWLREGQAKGFT